MRILITGATGFIGHHLVERLAGEHEVYALVRRMPPQTQPTVRYVVQDLTQPLAGAAFPRQLDAIIHQAAVIDTDAVDDATPFLVNVVATWRLLTYAASVGVRTFVHASTGGIYGCAAHPLCEEDAPNPMDLYSLTKAQAELAVQAAPGGFHRAVLRYFFPYGVGTPNPIPSYVRAAVDSKPIQIVAGGGPRFNPLHISDAVAATVAALTLTGNHTLNVAGTEIATFAEIATRAADGVGRQALFRELSLAETIPYYRSNLVADITRMRELLGVTPRVSLATGIRELVQAML